MHIRNIPNKFKSINHLKVLLFLFKSEEMIWTLTCSYARSRVIIFLVSKWFWFEISFIWRSSWIDGLFVSVCMLNFMNFINGHFWCDLNDVHCGLAARSFSLVYFPSRSLSHPILHAHSIKWNLMKSQWLSHQMNWWWKQPQIWHRTKKNTNDIGRPILNDLF